MPNKQPQPRQNLRKYYYQLDPGTIRPPQNYNQIIAHIRAADALLRMAESQTESHAAEMLVKLTLQENLKQRFLHWKTKKLHMRCSYCKSSFFVLRQQEQRPTEIGEDCYIQFIDPVCAVCRYYKNMREESLANTLASSEHLVAPGASKQ